MYSITGSPAVAVDLAHAIQDEHFRQARPARRRPKRLSARPDGRRQWTSPWSRRPAVAF